MKLINKIIYRSIIFKSYQDDLDDIVFTESKNSTSKVVWFNHLTKEWFNSVTLKCSIDTNAGNIFKMEFFLDNSKFKKLKILPAIGNT